MHNRYDALQTVVEARQQAAQQAAQREHDIQTATSKTRSKPNMVRPFHVNHSPR